MNHLAILALQTAVLDADTLDVVIRDNTATLPADLWITLVCLAKNLKYS